MRKRKIKINEVNGRYQIDYRDLNNKRHRKRFNTLRDAEAAADEIRYSLLYKKKLEFVGPPSALSSEITIKEAINRYVETSCNKRSGHFKRTERWHFERLFVFLVNSQGINKLKQVETFSLEAFKAHLRNEVGCKGSTINRMFATYSPFFKKCHSWGLLARNPMDGLNKEKEIPPNINRWSPEQRLYMIEKVPLWAKECLGFMAVTGCRPIDICRAKWGDVNFEEKSIRFISKKGNLVSDSYFPLADSLLQFLANKRKVARRKFQAHDHHLIFKNSRGEPVTTDCLGKQVRKVRGEANITLYGLRHAFIDDLINMNINPRDVQLLARHKKFETTIRYTHRKNDHLRSVVNLFDDTKMKQKED